MAKGASRLAAGMDGMRGPVNTGTPWLDADVAEARVVHLQRKLHAWASNDDTKRFRDLWNLVCDPATLQVAWAKVRSNKGSRTAGIDAFTRYHVEHRYGVDRFLSELRRSLRDRTFRPLPVRERGIPKKGGKVRYLGIPTVPAYCRVVQYAV
jgi:RNA-directed DNA polymerase